MSNHPFRAQELQPLCLTCRKVTSASCVLCKRPYCPEHLDYGWRCRRCAPRVASGYRHVFRFLLLGVLLLSVLCFSSYLLVFC